MAVYCYGSDEFDFALPEQMLSYDDVKCSYLKYQKVASKYKTKFNKAVAKAAEEAKLDWDDRVEW
jgi:hypothetical protein